MQDMKAGSRRLTELPPLGEADDPSESDRFEEGHVAQIEQMRVGTGAPLQQSQLFEEG